MVSIESSTNHSGAKGVSITFHFKKSLISKIFHLKDKLNFVPSIQNVSIFAHREKNLHGEENIFVHPIIDVVKPS